MESGPGRGPEGEGLRRVARGQTFRVFSLSRHNFLPFIPLLGVFSWIFGCFEDRGLEMCMFGSRAVVCVLLGVLGLLPPPPAPTRIIKAAGASHDSPEPKRSQFSSLWRVTSH